MFINVEGLTVGFVSGADFILMKYVRIFAEYPILINRPIVVTPLETRLCRPSEVVLDILPDSQKAAFTKEDGEKSLGMQDKE